MIRYLIPEKMKESNINFRYARSEVRPYPFRRIAFGVLCGIGGEKCNERSFAP